MLYLMYEGRKDPSLNLRPLNFFWNFEILKFEKQVVPMLYFMYEGRKDPSKIGLIHICTFILLLLSGERNFCVNLNAAFNKKLPVCVCVCVCVCVFMCLHL